MKPELMPILKELEGLEEHLRRIRQRLYALAEAGQVGPDANLYRRADGRLTDVGIAAVEASFAAGAKVNEVARQFDITPSAASNRKKIWEGKSITGN
jgi:hypothetical protein